MATNVNQHETGTPLKSREERDALQMRAWETFAHDLEALLRTSEGKCVAYRGAERLLIGDSMTAVYEECLRRGHPPEELFVEWIYPSALEPPLVSFPTVVEDDEDQP